MATTNPRPDTTREPPTIMHPEGSAHGTSQFHTLIVGILGALWSASNYVGAFTRDNNVIFANPRDGRSGSCVPCRRSSLC